MRALTLFILPSELCWVAETGEAGAGCDTRGADCDRLCQRIVAIGCESRLRP
jgi:hypothetical protein